MPTPLFNHCDETGTFYRYFSILAGVGVIGAYLTAELAQPGVVLESLRSRQFNLVRYAIPYGTGWATLRYAAIIAGAIAIRRVVRRGRPTLLDVVNILLLIGCAAVASRLSLLMAALIVAYLFAKDSGTLRPRKGAVLAIGLALVTVLIGFNWIRNSTFYEQKGVDNAIVAAYVEMVSYLGAPTQAAVGVASAGPEFGHTIPGSDRVAASLALLLPTYANSAGEIPVGVMAEPKYYERYIDIDSTRLTTNSVLADTSQELGVFSYPVIMTILLASAFLVGHFSRYAGSASLIAPVLLYGFAEFWRTFLFNAGVIHFLVLAILLLTVLARRKRVAPQGQARA